VLKYPLYNPGKYSNLAKQSTNFLTRTKCWFSSTRSLENDGLDEGNSLAIYRESDLPANENATAAYP
jgi:hypothetical protein